MHNKTRVVITGIGIVSPIGIGVDNFWKALVKGVSGLRSISVFDTSRLRYKFASQISDYDFKKYLDQKEFRCFDRATRLILKAAELAVKDSRLREKDNPKTGVVTATVFGCFHSTSQFHRSALIQDSRFVNPRSFAATLMNSPSSMVSIQHKFQGLNTTLANSFSGGLEGLNYACQMIKSGRAKIILTGGLNDLGIEVFLLTIKSKLLAFMKKEADSVCLPFNRFSKGILFGEAGVVLTLEELGHAQRRKANILAEIIGYGNNFDATVKGIKTAMNLALEDAKINSGDVDYICASANGLATVDEKEALAINNVFRDSKNLVMSSIKSMLGECFAASGVIQTAVACLAMRHSLVPPTINYYSSNKNFKLPGIIKNRIIKSKTNIALINSIGPVDKNNSFLLIQRFNA